MLGSLNQVTGGSLAGLRVKKATLEFLLHDIQKLYKASAVLAWVDLLASTGKLRSCCAATGIFQSPSYWSAYKEEHWRRLVTGWWGKV